MEELCIAHRLEWVTENLDSRVPCCALALTVQIPFDCWSDPEIVRVLFLDLYTTYLFVKLWEFDKFLKDPVVVLNSVLIGLPRFGLLISSIVHLSGVDLSIALRRLNLGIVELLLVVL